MIHGLTALLASALAADLLGSRGWGLGVAAFWSTSALISESVLWSAARVHSLAGLLGLASLICLRRLLATRRGSWGLVSLGLLLLSLGVKETAIAMAGVLLAALILDEGRTRWGLGSAIAGLTGVFFVVRLAVSVPPVTTDPGRMVLKLLLALDGYFLPGIRSAGGGIVGVGTVIFIGLAVGFVLTRDRSGLLAVTLLLAPLLITIPRPMHSSRYDYLPLLGAFLMLALAVQRMLRRMKDPRIGWVALALVAVVNFPAQWRLLRIEERAYDRLGAAGRRLVSDYRGAITALPCAGDRILVVNLTRDQVGPLAREVLERGMPKLIQRRRGGIRELVNPEHLVTFVRYDSDLACTLVPDKDRRSWEPFDGTIPATVLVLEERKGRVAHPPLPADLLQAIRAGRVRSTAGELSPIP